ncbi:hypothetical protein [Amycolatopsis sp. CA-230715]|uniref:hypothetical protein n=1 Tax=Amycolatopsis sp. CA-230715 TaxID=2745196 RepID=UPI001C0142D1|nr:hypothetical protein [Amycolatopsis sp. CA-230715]QWF82489.1 hypothetical protein HUW46_05926 [Amycolatopsis sp. CA-230715]
MNRIEFAVAKHVPDTASAHPLLEVTAEQMITCTPTIFSAFGIGYLVGKAFGPSEESEPGAAAAFHDNIATMTGGELIQFRRDSLA